VKAAAKRRLDQAADVLVQRLLAFALDGGTSDNVALQAIIAALDRAGLNVKQAMELSAKEPELWEEFGRRASWTFQVLVANPPILPTPASPQRSGAICSRTQDVPEPHRRRRDSLSHSGYGENQLTALPGRAGAG